MMILEKKKCWIKKERFDDVFPTTTKLLAQNTCKLSETFSLLYQQLIGRFRTGIPSDGSLAISLTACVSLRRWLDYTKESKTSNRREWH
mmetsp:Transcript_26671/g.62350  ORF Transcript_26671/g.62350 Transcript_26671/m.62350 type:complete len:89 (-) Transcript_26671:276-542(-)